MTDEQIIDRCKQEIEKHRSISVSHVLTSVLNLEKNDARTRRIKSKLLEDNYYVERKDRIVINPTYEEKTWAKSNPFTANLIIGIVIAIVTAVLTTIGNNITQKGNLEKIQQAIAPPNVPNKLDSSVHR